LLPDPWLDLKGLLLREEEMGKKGEEERRREGGDTPDFYLD